MTKELSSSICLQDFRESNSVLSESSDGSTRLISAEDCPSVSRDLGFDSRRVCAAHNVVALSRCADSVKLATVQYFVAGMVETDAVELFVVDVIRANARDLAGTVIDEVTGIVRFREHDAREAQWKQSVLQAL